MRPAKPHGKAQPAFSKPPRMPGPTSAPGLLESLEVITTKARDDKASRIMLGRWLEVHKGRVVGGLRLEGTRDEHCKVNLWGVKCCG